MRVRNRTHYSASPIQRVMSVEQAKGPTFKPKGLWYDLNDAWKYTQAMGGELGAHAYVVEVDPKQILVLATRRDVEEFRARYESIAHEEFEVIDWKAVARACAGIEVHNPRSFNVRSTVFPSDRPTWLDTWDVSSGCVWNEDAVRLRPLPLAI